MSKINDGGPAFPLMTPYRIGPDGNKLLPNTGMSLRDYFAGQIASGWLSSFGDDDKVDIPGVARFAYLMSDALLAARDAGQL